MSDRWGRALFGCSIMEGRIGGGRPLAADVSTLGLARFWTVARQGHHWTATNG
jgi:hypothetical protein